MMPQALLVLSSAAAPSAMCSRRPAASLDGAAAATSGGARLAGVGCAASMLATRGLRSFFLPLARGTAATGAGSGAAATGAPSCHGSGAVAAVNE